MRRILGLTSIVFLLSLGTAFADRDHRGGRGGGGGGGFERDHRGGPGPAPVYREHRGGGPVYRGGGGPRYVRVSGGRYMFPGGVVRVVGHPVHPHFYNVHVRPAVIVENYDPVPGYVWVGGNWRWGGAEWVWVPGYFSAEAYAPSAAVVVHAPAPPAVVVQPPSVGISAGVSIH